MISKGEEDSRWGLCVLCERVTLTQEDDDSWTEGRWPTVGGRSLRETPLPAAERHRYGPSEERQANRETKRERQKERELNYKGRKRGR